MKNIGRSYLKYLYVIKCLCSCFSSTNNSYLCIVIVKLEIMAERNSPLILGTEPIGKLLIQYSVPAIIAMTVTSLYNIIDSIFIGHGVGALAIAGLAITFPLMNLVVAFCTLVGIGGATISSIF